MITVFFLGGLLIVAIGAVLLAMRSGTAGKRHGQSGEAAVHDQETARKNHPVE